MHHDVTQRITALHHFEFSSRDHPVFGGDDGDVTHIGLRVVFEAAILFGDTDFGFNGFGFKRGEEWNDWWSEFHTAPLTFCLNGTLHEREPKWDWSGAACMALAVDDVPAAVAKCRKRGVKILIEPVETRVCWMAWIADPAGNRICLHSRKDGTAG